MRFLLLLLLLPFMAMGQQTDSWWQNFLASRQDTLLKKITGQPETYRVQLIYTRIDRDQQSRPSFKNYYFHYDARSYFNPASMVKMPLAFLAMEKLNELKAAGVNRDTRICFDSALAWQHPYCTDTTQMSGKPSIAHFIKRAFLISENDPYNRLYQFVGQQQINRRLHQMGYTDARITRMFLGLPQEQNRCTPPVRMMNERGRILYQQPAQCNTDSFDFSQAILIGKAHMNSRDSLVQAPFDFTRQNNISLGDLQQLLQSVLFPASVSMKRRFRMQENDRRFLLQYLSQYPSETADPLYDTAVFYDSYVKFFFRDSTKKMPAHVRVFNKVGWSYGFLTDVSYVVDFKNKVEYMLAATVYVNSDGVVNDGRYDYATMGWPFLYQLGQAVYQYELKRTRKHRPDLSAFRLPYTRRTGREGGKVLHDVDN